MLGVNWCLILICFSLMTNDVELFYVHSKNFYIFLWEVFFQVFTHCLTGLLVFFIATLYVLFFLSIYMYCTYFILVCNLVIFIRMSFNKQKCVGLMKSNAILYWLLWLYSSFEINKYEFLNFIFCQIIFATLGSVSFPSILKLDFV